MLPYELGKLFHLHVLGLHGNPLGKDVMSIYNEPNGTNKLLTYMLDNLSGECELLELGSVFFVWFWNAPRCRHVFWTNFIYHKRNGR